MELLFSSFNSREVSIVNFTEGTQDSDLRHGAGAIGLSYSGEWLESTRISNIVEGNSDMMVAVVECKPTCQILDGNGSNESFGTWTGYNQSRIVGVDTNTMNIEWVVDLNASAIHDIIAFGDGFLVSASIQYWTSQLPLESPIPGVTVQWWGVDSTLVYLNKTGGVEKWVRLADKESTPLDILKMSADDEGFTVLGHLNWGFNWTPELDMNKEMTISVLNNGSEKIDFISLEITPNDVINNLTGVNSPIYIIRFNFDFTINWSKQILVAHDFVFTIATGYANEASSHFAFLSTQNGGTSLLLNFGYTSANSQSSNIRGYFDFSDGIRWNVSDHIIKNPHLLLLISLDQDGDFKKRTFAYPPSGLDYNTLNYTDDVDTFAAGYFMDRLSLYEIGKSFNGSIVGYFETSLNLTVSELGVNNSVASKTISPGIYRFRYSYSEGFNTTYFLPILTDSVLGFSLSSLATDSSGSVLISGYTHSNLVYSTIHEVDGMPFTSSSTEVVPTYAVFDELGYIVAHTSTFDGWDEYSPQYIQLFTGGTLMMGNDCFTTYWNVGQIILGDIFPGCGTPNFNQSEWGLNWPMIGQWERDGDSIPVGEDICPDVTDPLQSDIDGDGVGDLCDWDADSDGVHNGDDSCQYSDFETNSSGNLTDTDSDGCYDFEDDDIDGDGKDNDEDSCPISAYSGNSTQNLTDTDSDGCYDFEDDDIDGDGVRNEADECPESDVGWTSNSSSDLDGDGCLDPQEDNGGDQSDPTTNSTNEEGNQTPIDQSETPLESENSTSDEGNQTSIDQLEPALEPHNSTSGAGGNDSQLNENNGNPEFETGGPPSTQIQVLLAYFFGVLSLIVMLSLFDFHRRSPVELTNPDRDGQS